jgi:hypothetical protein
MWSGCISVQHLHQNHLRPYTLSLKTSCNGRHIDHATCHPIKVPAGTIRMSLSCVSSTTFGPSRENLPNKSSLLRWPWPQQEGTCPLSIKARRYLPLGASAVRCPGYGLTSHCIAVTLGLPREVSSSFDMLGTTPLDRPAPCLPWVPAIPGSDLHYLHSNTSPSASTSSVRWRTIGPEPEGHRVGLAAG